MVNRMRFSRARAWLVPVAVLVLTLASFPAAAQTATASLDVVAVDGSGGPLPGVTVEVKRPDTGFSRAGVTGTGGLASFAALPPGTYDVAVKLQGFETVEQKGAVATTLMLSVRLPWSVALTRALWPTRRTTPFCSTVSKP